MNVQFIENNGQPEYAVIPVKHYHILLEKAEMLDDVKAFDIAIKQDEESIPAGVVSQLLEGENKIKVWRNYRALTQSELANKTGLAQATVAQIESGKRQGSVGVLKKIADALSVDLDDLID